MAARSTTRRKSRERSDSAAPDASASEFVTVLVAIVSPGRQLTARRLVVAVTEQIVRLHDLVDLASALVDHCTLAVPVKPAHRVLIGIAIGTVDLHGIAGRTLRSDRRKPLGEACLARIAAPFVLQPARTHPEQP